MQQIRCERLRMRDRFLRIAEHADSLCVKPPLWGIDPGDSAEQARRLEHVLMH